MLCFSGVFHILKTRLDGAVMIFSCVSCIFGNLSHVVSIVVMAYWYWKVDTKHALPCPTGISWQIKIGQSQLVTFLSSGQCFEFLQHFHWKGIRPEKTCCSYIQRFFTLQDPAQPIVTPQHSCFIRSVYIKIIVFFFKDKIHFVCSEKLCS